MILDYEPGDKVTNPQKKEWGIGQVQSIINDKVTVNFENAGKKVINAKNVELKKPNPLPNLKAIQLSGINKNNSIVFEDSYPGLKSSLAANLPTIFVPSNIPIVLAENIQLDCILDSLGDENNVANVIKGPKLKKSYVDYSFLSDYLMTVNNAKN